MRDFLRSGLLALGVTLRAADQCDLLDFECPGKPQTVGLVRQVAPNGQVRVLMTNLFDVVHFPASHFGDLYHQRWRIKEAGRSYQPCSGNDGRQVLIRNALLVLRQDGVEFLDGVVKRLHPGITILGIIQAKLH